MKLARKNYRKFEVLATTLKTIVTFVNIATASTFVHLSASVFELLVKPISTGAACGYVIFKKVSYVK